MQNESNKRNDSPLRDDEIKAMEFLTSIIRQRDKVDLVRTKMVDGTEVAVVSLIDKNAVGEEYSMYPMALLMTPELYEKVLPPQDTVRKEEHESKGDVQ